MTVEANEGIVSPMLEDTVMNLDENLEVLMTTPHFFLFIFILFGIEFVSNISVNIFMLLSLWWFFTVTFMQSVYFY
jgi:hypothetical protein